MVVYQAFNPKIKAYVKYHFVKGKGFEVFDVKQRKHLKPYKKIKIKGRKRW